jgi:hypothetical protein
VTLARWVFLACLILHEDKIYLVNPCILVRLREKLVRIELYYTVKERLYYKLARTLFCLVDDNRILVLKVLALLAALSVFVQSGTLTKTVIVISRKIKRTVIK